MSTKPCLTGVALLGSVMLFGLQAAKSADPEEGPSHATVAEWNERRLEPLRLDAKALVELTKARLDEGDLKSAAACLSKWKELVDRPGVKWPFHSGDLENLAKWELLSGDLEYSKGNREAAARWWVGYTGRAPEDIEGWQRLAGVYDELGDLPDALTAIDQVVKISSTAQNLISRAKLKMQARDWDGAAKDVREANRLDATDNAVQQLFPVFEENRTWLTDAKRTAAVIKKFPDDYESRLDEAELFVGKGLKWLAGKDVQIALEANPESIRARLLYKVVFRKPDSDAEAEVSGLAEEITKNGAQLRRWDQHPDPEACAQFCFDHQLPLLALHYSQVVDGSTITAKVLFQEQRLKDAGIAARRAAEVHPNDADAWLVLGQVNMANGNMQDAIDCFDKSKKLHKTEEVMALRAEALRRQTKK